MHRSSTPSGPLPKKGRRDMGKREFGRKERRGRGSGTGHDAAAAEFEDGCTDKPKDVQILLEKKKGIWPMMRPVT